MRLDVLSFRVLDREVIERMLFVISGLVRLLHLRSLEVSWESHRGFPGRVLRRHSEDVMGGSWRFEFGGFGIPWTGGPEA